MAKAQQQDNGKPSPNLKFDKAYFISAPLPGPPPRHSVKAMQQELLENYFSDNSEIYRKLNEAKSSGWNSDSLDTVFNKYKVNLPTNVQQKDPKEMQAIMKAVMLEVDSQTGYPIRDRCGTFLDVCCAPGGFTDYILSAAPESIGMGVTMAYRDGGHAVQIPNSRRFWCHFANVIDDPKSIIYCKPFYRMPFVPPAYQYSETPRGRTPRPNTNSRGCSPTMNACDVVILDGHYITPPEKLKAYNQSLKFQSLNNLPPPEEGELCVSKEEPPKMGELAFGVGGSPKYDNMDSPQTPLNAFGISMPIPEGGAMFESQDSVDEANTNQREPKQDIGSIGLQNMNIKEGQQKRKGAYDAVLPSGLLPPGAPTDMEMAFETIRTQNSLWIAQLIVAIRNLRDGGTLILRGTTKPDQFLQAILCLTCRIFRGQLRPVKPTVSHMMRSQFFVVCRGFDLELTRKIDLLSRLEGALARVKEATTDEELMWPLLEGMQEFSTPQVFIQVWGAPLMTFMEPLWKFQTLALQAMVANEGKRRQGGRRNKVKVCFYHKLGKCRRQPENCWYAHDVSELVPPLQQAVTKRLLPLLGPWQPFVTSPSKRW